MALWHRKGSRMEEKSQLVTPSSSCIPDVLLVFPFSATHYTHLSEFCEMCGIRKLLYLSILCIIYTFYSSISFLFFPRFVYTKFTYKYKNVLFLKNAVSHTRREFGAEGNDRHRKGGRREDHSRRKQPVINSVSFINKTLVKNFFPSYVRKLAKLSN